MKIDIYFVLLHPQKKKRNMKLYSDNELAQLLDQPIFHLISDAADRLGVECYVVGGYVRDLFLERPSNDIDVVVVGKPHPLPPSPKERGRKNWGNRFYPARCALTLGQRIRDVRITHLSMVNGIYWD